MFRCVSKIIKFHGQMLNVTRNICETLQQSIPVVYYGGVNIYTLHQVIKRTKTENYVNIPIMYNNCICSIGVEKKYFI